MISKISLIFQIHVKKMFVRMADNASHMVNITTVTVKMDIMALIAQNICVIQILAEMEEHAKPMPKHINVNVLTILWENIANILNVLKKLASIRKNATKMDASAKKNMKALCVTKSKDVAAVSTGILIIERLMDRLFTLWAFASIPWSRIQEK